MYIYIYVYTYMWHIHTHNVQYVCIYIYMICVYVVLDCFDGHIGGDHAVATTVGEREAAHVGRLTHVLHEFLPDFTFKNCLGMLVITEEERHI